MVRDPRQPAGLVCVVAVCAGDAVRVTERVPAAKAVIAVAESPSQAARDRGQLVGSVAVGNGMGVVDRQTVRRPATSLVWSPRCRCYQSGTAALLLGFQRTDWLTRKLEMRLDHLDIKQNSLRLLHPYKLP